MLMIRIVDFATFEKDIRSVRNAVFTEEQKISSLIDFDGKDPLCDHVLCWDDQGIPVGTGRMQKSGHIGRLAVIKEQRHKGIGTAMINAFCELAKRKYLSYVYLNSQESAIAFYLKIGFIEEGEIFFEAGIAHRKMTFSL